MRIGDANDIIAFWLGGVAAGFAPAQGGTPADGEELFDVQGMPDESHLPPEDRRSLPEADSAGAVIPESDGFPGEESLERQASERRIRLFADPQAEASGQPSGSSSAPEASPPESEFAVPEVTEEEIYRVESPKKLYALDYLLAALIGLCGFGLVVATYSGIGMCWDEAYYYEPARKTLDWLGAMASSASKPISPAAIDASSTVDASTSSSTSPSASSVTVVAPRRIVAS